MIDESARTHDHAARPPPAPSSVRLLPAEGEPTVFDTARELLSTDFYLRKWGRLGMRNRSEEVDDFGFDPVYEKKVQPIFDFLYDQYFRVEATGLEQHPERGALPPRREPLRDAAVRRRDDQGRREASAPRQARRAVAGGGLHLPLSRSSGRSRTGSARCARARRTRSVSCAKRRSSPCSPKG